MGVADCARLGPTWDWIRGCSGGAAPPQPSRERIVPRIRNVQMADALVSVLQRERDVVPLEPLVGELVVGYAFDLPDLFQFLRLEDLERPGLGRGDLRTVAIENLERTCGGGIRFVEQGPVIELDAGPHAAAVLLIDPFWEDLRTHAGTDLVVGVASDEAVFGLAGRLGSRGRALRRGGARCI